LQRLRQIALPSQHVAHRVVRSREIALPASIAGIRLRKALSNSEAVAKGVHRISQIALRYEHVTNLIVADREIALPIGIAGIGLG
jgi:hypothetical protein